VVESGWLWRGRGERAFLTDRADGNGLPTCHTRRLRCLAGSPAMVRPHVLLAGAAGLACFAPRVAANYQRGPGPNKLARVPPMGWMSWQGFRAATNCTLAGDDCINEAMYRSTADALVTHGLAAAGFASVHLDDAIMAKARDPVTHELLADPERFPSGFKALGDYIHAKNMTFAMYTAESTSTCGGWPGSLGYEALDAATFAKWGCDYLKADGCGDPANYPKGYPALGSALQASGRDVVYSCSWPAYLGNDETQKPFAAFIAAGCNRTCHLPLSLPLPPPLPRWPTPWPPRAPRSYPSPMRPCAVLSCAVQWVPSWPGPHRAALTRAWLPSPLAS
jgi:hypothetical protein